MPGTLALVGGGEWRDGCEFDAGLLAASGGAEVAVLPTGAAYEHPDRTVADATAWFAQFGATVRGVPVLTRPDAMDPELADVVRRARFVYLAGESHMHLRSVLLHSAVWDAMRAAFAEGTVLAGTAAGASVLCDPMVDPRGGAFTLGLGLLRATAVIPHHQAWSEDKARRTERIAPAGTRLVGVDDTTALIWSRDSGWTVAGAGAVSVMLDGRASTVDELPAPSTG